MLIPQIYPVTCHTDHVGQGSTFVAIKGFKNDGTTYISTALSKGATTIVVDRNDITDTLQNECARYEATLVTVEDTRKELALRSAQALGNPASKLKIIGITGTKGKTTTTYIIEYILRSAGFKTALMGTIKNKILDNEVTSEHTTPSSDYLHMFFQACVNAGVDYVVMEVSSHALSLDRVHGVMFAAVGFTNLAPEHMDFYATLEDYFAAKTKLFNHLAPGGAIIINGDDEWGQKACRQLANAGAGNVITFNIQQYKVIPTGSQQYVVDVLQNSLEGLRLVMRHPHEDMLHGIALHCSKVFGLFNAYNISMAFLLCTSLGIPDRVTKEALSFFQGVPGRLQLHTLKNGCRAFVDYAHNPSSFEAVLKTLRPMSKHLIVVFGCGGDRDTTKRPVMGQLAALYADNIIITDDNPRSEPHEIIAQEIIAGIPESQRLGVICQLDRHKAIKNAVHLADKNSVIAILGKGHEQYYIAHGQTLYFDDMEEIRQY
ncbi:MAG: UDP-N-acetylmuramoyl-L-alanyl-D-glutamate--2,6-diaminopimelate ligase [Candidatus Babeliales bacterium]